MIRLPTCQWFFQKKDGKFLTNLYSGSLATDPQTGCMNSVSFLYRAFVEIADEERALVAAYLWKQPWNAARDEEWTCASFALSPEGIAQAEEWLKQAYEGRKA